MSRKNTSIIARILIVAILTAVPFNIASAAETRTEAADVLTLGRDFVVAMNSAANVDGSDHASRAAVVELAYLIDRLGGQPEADQLQKVMRAVIRGGAAGREAGADVEKAMRAFSARSVGRSKWYFEVGSRTARVVFSSFNNDAAAARKDLLSVFEMTRSMPAGIPEEFSRDLSALAAYKDKPELSYATLSEIVGLGVALFDRSVR